MASTPVPFSDCRLMTSINIALRFAADFSTSIAKELATERGFEPAPEFEGEPLEYSDTSALDSLTIRLAYLCGHLTIVLPDEAERTDLIRILEEVLAQMKIWQQERKLSGFILFSWQLSIREVERAVGALQTGYFGYCEHSPNTGEPTWNWASSTPEEADFCDGEGI